MPTVAEIEKSLYELAPGSLKMDWDNVGLLVGDPDRQVQRVLVALDVVPSVVEEALAGDFQLIVAHHPVMNCKWLPVQTLRQDTPQGRLLRKLVQSDLAAICMHTNRDAARGGVNDALADALRVIDPGPLDESQIGRWGHLASAVPLKQFVGTVCRTLHCNGVRYADAGKMVSQVAVGGGACGDMIPQALALGCDTFVTSDLSYHQFLDAPAMGINLIDAGHFPTEDVICPVLVQFLQTRFPQLTVQKSASHCEVIQYYVEGEK